jgi:signal transduction histidine kinase
VQPSRTRAKAVELHEHPVSPDFDLDDLKELCRLERAEVADTSLGLLSMEDRVAALGGSMLVETGPKAGTAVRIGLPLTAST